MGYGIDVEDFGGNQADIDFEARENWDKHISRNKHMKRVKHENGKKRESEEMDDFDGFIQQSTNACIV